MSGLRIRFDLLNFNFFQHTGMALRLNIVEPGQMRSAAEQQPIQYRHIDMLLSKLPEPLCPDY